MHARSGKSGGGEMRSGGTQVILAALLYTFLVSLGVIIFSYYGPQMSEVGSLLSLCVLLVVVIIGGYWLGSRSRTKDSGEEWPRGASMLCLAGVATVVAGFTVLFGMVTLLPLEARSPHLFFLFLGLFAIGIGLVVAGIVVKESDSLSPVWGPENIDVGRQCQ